MSANSVMDELSPGEEGEVAGLDRRLHHARLRGLKPMKMGTAAGQVGNG